MKDHDDISNPTIVRFIAQLFRAAYEQEISSMKRDRCLTRADRTYVVIKAASPFRNSCKFGVPSLRAPTL